MTPQVIQQVVALGARDFSCSAFGSSIQALFQTIASKSLLSGRNFASYVSGLQIDTYMSFVDYLIIRKNNFAKNIPHVWNVLKFIENILRFSSQVTFLQMEPIEKIGQRLKSSKMEIPKVGTYFHYKISGTFRFLCRYSNQNIPAKT